MSFSEIYRPDRSGISFELFPPKTEKGEAALYRHVEQLVEFDPDFITCTYGAGGSTQSKTLEIVTQVKKQFNVPVASHLTCVGSTVEQLRDYLTQAKEAGVDFIVALRGDPPQGEEKFVAVDGGLRYANELVELIRSEFPNFGIAVAGYPEKHQEAASAEIDLENLKRKVDAGGDVVLTQLFYENQNFYEFQKRYQEIGITAPLIPGILPVTNLAQIQRISSLCGAVLPESFVAELSKRDDEDWQFQVGVDFATQQVKQLIADGARGVHFYVLNKSQATSGVLRGIRG
ncbi:MAG: methylenetetrahydrofolate reductase (NADPH) [Pirellulaceae bacterium]|jgi:methylenetetrahydrofolate reductase (NADPH)